MFWRSLKIRVGWFNYEYRWFWNCSLLIQTVFGQSNQKYQTKALVDVEEFQDSLVLLESLVEEDETNLDAVYMMAFVNFKLKNYNITNEILNDLRNDEKIVE